MQGQLDDEYADEIIKPNKQIGWLNLLPNLRRFAFIFSF